MLFSWTFLVHHYLFTSLTRHVLILVCSVVLLLMRWCVCGTAVSKCCHYNGLMLRPFLLWSFLCWKILRWSFTIKANIYKLHISAWKSKMCYNISLLFSWSEMVESLILRVKAANIIRWIIVIPLMHFLKGTSKPFEPVFNKVNSQYGQSWAGLQGLKVAGVPSGQERRYWICLFFQMFRPVHVWLTHWSLTEWRWFRAMLNLMKTHGHLVEVDKLLARSWMYLMTVDDLVECSSIIHVELLDILQVFTMKCPDDINYSTSTVSVNLWPLTIEKSKKNCCCVFNCHYLILGCFRYSGTHSQSLARAKIQVKCIHFFCTDLVLKCFHKCL